MAIVTGNALPNVLIGTNLADTISGLGGNDVLIGLGGADLLNGGAGADVMIGGTGNDIYMVDNAGDTVTEGSGGGRDTVFSLVDYALGDKVEDLVLQGNANLFGIGNDVGNNIQGNNGDNTLDGGAGTDVLRGNDGNDTFVFSAGFANGDAILDFAGNGAALGDSLQFEGYGPGATFTNVDATHWQITYDDGASHETITITNGGNGVSIDANDFIFV